MTLIAPFKRHFILYSGIFLLFSYFYQIDVWGAIEKSILSYILGTAFALYLTFGLIRFQNLSQKLFFGIGSLLASTIIIVWVDAEPWLFVLDEALSIFSYGITVFLIVLLIEHFKQTWLILLGLIIIIFGMSARDFYTYLTFERHHDVLVQIQNHQYTNRDDMLIICKSPMMQEVQTICISSLAESEKDESVCRAIADKPLRDTCVRRVTLIKSKQ